MVAIFFSVCGYQVWSEHAYQNAVRDAKEAGFQWMCVDTISLIRQDWHAALKKETWGAHPRGLDMGEVRDLGRYREMLHRLRPTQLAVSGCENVDGLKGLTSLQRLWLRDCIGLQNVDVLKGLTSLQELDLSGCTNIPAASLRELRAALPKTYITFPDGPQ